jgi:hypothetical protein
MAKYDWDVDEALGFVASKNEELEVAEKYARILRSFEKNRNC